MPEAASPQRRVVLITGCSSGIGLQAALAFARAGDRVWATVRDPARAQALREAVAAGNLDIVIATLDVSRSERFASFVSELLAREGRIDVLVNNAAVLPVGAFEDLAETEFRAVMETDFFGPALLMRAVLPAMRSQRSGHLISIGSLSALAGRAGDAAYSAAKFALDGLCEALRQEVAHWNIRVSLVHPGQYATEMFRVTAEGSLGSCGPDSPYLPLIAHQQAALRAGLGSGLDPRHLAELLVEVSCSHDPRLRWPADALAERVLARLHAGDDAGRQAFLAEVAGATWWMAGRDAPEVPQ